MKTTLTAQQLSFYTRNGYIEFEYDPAEIFPLIRSPGRDLFRSHPPLQNFLMRKLGPIALALTGKKQLRLGCDQTLPAADLPKKALPVKDLFSLQGLALGALIAEHPAQPAKRAPLGLLPLPSSPTHILFFKPTLLLDWSHVSSDLYLALFTLSNGIYVHNPKDPQTNYLKPLGYHFGDLLKNEFHPLIMS